MSSAGDCLFERSGLKSFQSGWLQPCSEILNLARIWLVVTNALAYSTAALITAAKGVSVQVPGVCLSKMAAFCLFKWRLDIFVKKFNILFRNWISYFVLILFVEPFKVKGGFFCLSLSFSFRFSYSWDIKLRRQHHKISCLCGYMSNLKAKEEREIPPPLFPLPPVILVNFILKFWVFLFFQNIENFLLAI